jgi:hypothetical protein
VRDSVDPVEGAGQGAVSGCESEEADDPVHVNEEDRPSWEYWFQGFVVLLLR